MCATRKTPPPRSARLFSEPEKAAAWPAVLHTANIDGASRGNPGPASYGVMVRGPDGAVVFRSGKYLGTHSNNVAEYHALIAALDYAAAHKIRALRVRSDSELLVRQMKGEYRVKHPSLKPLHARACQMAAALAHFEIEHVFREQNAAADALANEALDRTGAGREVLPTGASERKSKMEKGSDEIRLRARYTRGALRPAAPLALSEGEEVEITVRRSGRHRPNAED